VIGAHRPECVERSIPDPSRGDSDVLEPESDLVLDDREDDLVFGILKDAGDGPGKVTGLRLTRPPTSTLPTN
jgi:hypothetical protein